MAHFNESLATVAGPGGSGYIDPTGRYVIGPQDEWGQGRPFHEGIAGVLLWGRNGASNAAALIDQRGRVVLSGSMVREGDHFSDGLMTMAERGKWGFVDKRFQWVIAPQYTNARAVSDGRAFRLEAYGASSIRLARPWYRQRHPTRSRRRRERVFGGLAAVRVDGLWGYVDRFGLWIVPPQFTRADAFWHGLAQVTWAGGHGYINRTGRLVWKSQ